MFLSISARCQLHRVVKLNQIYIVKSLLQCCSSSIIVIFKPERRSNDSLWALIFLNSPINFVSCSWDTTWLSNSNVDCLGAVCVNLHGSVSPTNDGKVRFFVRRFLNDWIHKRVCKRTLVTAWFLPRKTNKKCYLSADPLAQDLGKAFPEII
jgi:hypothetical protein